LAGLRDGFRFVSATLLADTPQRRHGLPEESIDEQKVVAGQDPSPVRPQSGLPQIAFLAVAAGSHYDLNQAAGWTR
jgi:hypothetical protein